MRTQRSVLATSVQPTWRILSSESITNKSFSGSWRGCGSWASFSPATGSCTWSRLRRRAASRTLRGARAASCAGGSQVGVQRSKAHCQIARLSGSLHVLSVPSEGAGASVFRFGRIPEDGMAARLGRCMQSTAATRLRAPGRLLLHHGRLGFVPLCLAAVDGAIVQWTGSFGFDRSGIVGDGAMHEVKAGTVKTPMTTITNHNCKVWSE